MKITVLQENFLKAAQDASKFISTKPQLAILSCFHIKAEKGEIVISATDLSMGIQISFGGKVESPGECVVPAKVLVDVIASLSRESITMEVGGEAVNISSPHTKTSIQGMSPKDYPTFPKMSGKSFSLSSKDLVTIVDRVSVASGIDETRPVFTSMLWNLGEESHFACSDGYRMALYRMKKKFGDDLRVLIPARLLMEVSRILARSPAKKVEISIPEELKQVSFSFDNVTVFTRIIEGDFPDYEKIMRQEYATECVFQKDELLQAVKSALIFARESSGIVRWSVGKKNTTVSSSSTALGNHETVLEGKPEKGDGGEIAFNGKYVMDFINVVAGNDVWFGMNEPLQPGEFRDAETPEFQYIVMPFRIQG